MYLESAGQEKSRRTDIINNVQWAEINQERETLEIEFYPRPDGHPWRIDYRDALHALSNAKDKLIGR